MTEPQSATGALLDAVLTRLKADPGVSALVGTKVFDQVPKAGLPWIFCGPVMAQRFEDCGSRAWTLRLRIFCATDAFNRDASWAIADAVDLALDGALPELRGPFVLTANLKTGDGGDVIDPTQLKEAFVDVSAIVFRKDA